MARKFDPDRVAELCASGRCWNGPSRGRPIWTGREQGPWADLTIQSPTGVSTDLYSNSPSKVRCTSPGRPTFTVAVSKP